MVFDFIILIRVIVILVVATLQKVHCQWNKANQHPPWTQPSRLGYNRLCHRCGMSNRHRSRTGLNIDTCFCFVSLDSITWLRRFNFWNTDAIDRRVRSGTEHIFCHDWTSMKQIFFDLCSRRRFRRHGNHLRSLENRSCWSRWRFRLAGNLFGSLENVFRRGRWRVFNHRRLG